VTLRHQLYSAWNPSPFVPAIRGERLASAASGRVLEVGVGSELSFALYGKNFEIAFGIDPSLRLITLARRPAAAAGIHADLLLGSATAIPALQNDVPLHRAVQRSGTIVAVPILSELQQLDPFWPQQRIAAWHHLADNCDRDTAHGDVLDPQPSQNNPCAMGLAGSRASRSEQPTMVDRASSSTRRRVAANEQSYPLGTTLRSKSWHPEGVRLA
jgi:hypothetical protein